MLRRTVVTNIKSLRLAYQLRHLSIFILLVVSAIVQAEETKSVGSKVGGDASACKQVVTDLKSVSLSQTSSDSELESYKAKLEICPTLSEGFYNLGIAYYQKSNYELARTNLEKAISIEPLDTYKSSLGHVLIGLGKLEPAKGLFKEILANDAKNYDSLLGLGLLNHQEGNLTGAITHLEEAILVKPEESLARFNLAVVYKKSNNLGKAAEQFYEVLERSPSDLEAMTQLGHLYLEMGNPQQAIRYLKQANEQQGQNATGLHALGVAYERAGEFEQAEVTLQAALQKNPEDIALVANLGVVLVENDNEEQAIEELNEALSKNPNNPRLLSILGWAQVKMATYEEAEKTLKKALEIENTNGIAHHNLGVLYDRTGRVMEAQDEFDLSKKLMPALATVID
jgi:tetratricopeptide (TPR) repeat protein